MSRNEQNGASAPKRVHVVAHTHWDREWYQPFPTFRYRLVAMVDELLDRLQDETMAHFPVFHLDGQTSLLRDYLEIRPEREPELRQLASEGRILVGPWYVQPDETLVAGEALIRNLQMGIETAEHFGSSMRVGYVPDIFGHIGQLPQILAGFGIDNAFLWRGMPAEDDATAEQGPTTEFLWRAPDNTGVLGIYLSTSGYFTAPLIEDAQEMAELLQVLESRALTDELLVMNGADHFHVQRDLPEALARLASEIPEYSFSITGMPDYVAAVRAALDDSGSTRKLRILQGELRDTRRNASGLFLLYGTLSSRMPLKQTNFDAERLLIRVIEPLAAVLAVADADPANAASGDTASAEVPNASNTDGSAIPRTRKRAAENWSMRWLRHLWKLLLENHAHDSICGCSIDQVARDMTRRYETLASTGRTLLRDIVAELAVSDFRADAADLQREVASTPAAQRVGAPLNAPFVLHNAAGVEQGGIAVAELPIPETTPPQPFFRAAQGRPASFVVFDEEGNSSPVQVLSVREGTGVDYAPRRAPHFHRRLYATFAFVPPAPLAPLSYANYRLAEDASISQYRMEGARAVTGADGSVTLSNERISVRLSREGTVALHSGKRVIEDLVRLEDDGDIGDLYNFSPPPKNRTISSAFSENRATESGSAAVEIELLHGGPQLVSARVRYMLRTPIGLTADRRERSHTEVKLPVELIFRLYRESQTLEISVVTENCADNHRLRAIFATDFLTDQSISQSTFCVERRSAEAKPVPSQYWREDAPSTHPQKEWTAVQGPNGIGLAVFNRGLPEYELRTLGARSELAVTLYRAVGNVHSRDSLTIDRRDWGIPFEVPDAQLHGHHRFELAVTPFLDSWENAAVDHAAEHFAYGYEVFPLDADKRYRVTAPLLRALSPQGIHVSSIKPSAEGTKTVVRLWNNRESSQEAVLELDDRVSSVALIDFAEDHRQDLPIERTDGLVTVRVPHLPWQITSIELTAGSRARTIHRK